jgi:hypothetical protein
MGESDREIVNILLRPFISAHPDQISEILITHSLDSFDRCVLREPVSFRSLVVRCDTNVVHILIDEQDIDSFVLGRFDEMRLQAIQRHQP